MFRLSPRELDLLDLTLAIWLEGDLFAGLPWATTRPRAPATAAALFGHDRPLLLAGNLPLVAWNLILPSRDGGVEIDPAVAATMLGDISVDARVADMVEPLSGASAAPARQNAEALAAKTGEWLRRGVPVRLLLHGASTAGCVDFAQSIAAVLGARLLNAAIPADMPVGERADAFLRIQRAALIAGYVPLWSAPPAPWPLRVQGSPLQFVIPRPGEAIEQAPSLRDIDAAVPALGGEDRHRLLLLAAPAAERWAPELVANLARGSSDLDDFIALENESVTTSDEARAFVSRRLARRIGAAGTLMPQAHGWNDLVLPPRTTTLLRQIPFEIRNREKLLGFNPTGAPTGISVLFCGASGTGKTMAAQVLARDLGVDLIRSDLAGTVSKYIGETAKNLRRIFEQVAGSGAILMFDEADALFARRTDVKDAHDRHANADTNYLLQLIESYDGAVLLASNKRDNIDPAFMRRLRHVVDFPAPGPAERLRLWQVHLGGRRPEEQADARLDALLADLAEAIDFSPAQIRNAAVTAQFAMLRREASALAPDDALFGVERELEKDGRALEPRERARLARHLAAGGVDGRL
ncbi:ATP-binding protein [Mesorhizobium sp. IMUNJ23232]